MSTHASQLQLSKLQLLKKTVWYDWKALEKASGCFVKFQLHLSALFSQSKQFLTDIHGPQRMNELWTTTDFGADFSSSESRAVTINKIIRLVINH